MRALVFALGLALAAAAAHAETIITAADAPKHVGETVTVEGTVSAVHTEPRSGVTFIDMGGRYPDQAFTGVIFKGDAGKFPNVESLTGKVVDIAGPVHDYKGKPEIILNDPAQLKTK
jgi:DNA/RNA endonuclease YhcR with UshA esterase domain